MEALGRSVKLHPLRHIGGIALIIAGIAGCLLPIIPGIPLLLAGAAMLGTEHPIVRPAKHWLEKRGWWPEKKQEQKDKDEPVAK
jgi:uncharacterized membrane protein YbaN (DUF454 family)